MTAHQRVDALERAASEAARESYRVRLNLEGRITELEKRGESLATWVDSMEQVFKRRIKSLEQNGPTKPSECPIPTSWRHVKPPPIWRRGAIAERERSRKQLEALVRDLATFYDFDGTDKSWSDLDAIVDRAKEMQP